jgi:primase-polymerase (primpol)-like protein
MHGNVTPVPNGGKPPITVDLSKVPQELKDRPAWVLHNAKVPKQLDGSNANVANENTWCSFDSAFTGWQGGGFEGLAFVLTAGDPYTVVDIDHRRDPETGEIDPSALEIKGDRVLHRG